MEKLKDPLVDKLDHKGDVTSFEISLVNKENHAMSIDCFVMNGKIQFNKVRIYTVDGI